MSPGRAVHDLLESAGAAFTTGLNAVGAVGAVVFARLAIATAVYLRHS